MIYVHTQRRQPNKWLQARTINNFPPHHLLLTYTALFFACPWERGDKFIPRYHSTINQTTINNRDIRRDQVKMRMMHLPY